MQTPLDMVQKWESESPDKLYLRQPINRSFHTWTWKEVGDEVRRMAAALKAMNLPEGSKVALLSKNCAHWIMADFATMMAGCVGVPLYPNLKDETIRYVLEHSEAKVIFIGKLDNWEEMEPGVPDHVTRIYFPHYGHDDAPGLHWDALTHEYEPIQGHVDTDPDALGSIIYTSGTTGNPKGVMHRFHNFGFAATHAVRHLNVTPKDRFFSYLPLSHIAERLLVQMGSLYGGGSMDFAESLDTFAEDLQKAKPTIFLGVPRIWTKFQQGILAKLPQSRLNLLLSIPIVSGLIKKKIKSGLGLDQARMCFTGAAAAPKALMEWFAKLDIRLQEAYAMTENCCYSHATLPNAIKFGSVGQPLPLCEVRLGDQNEVQVRHEALMQGYYKDSEKTKEAFTEDGFLRTGDEGYIDPSGHLFITGRVKDLFKTSKGKYVAPSPIELRLSANTHVGQVLVVGDGIPQPIALVVPSEEALKAAKEEIVRGLEMTIAEVNKVLDHHEHVHTAVVVDEDWTVENGLLTPTMKIKRNVVEKRHKDQYPAWYEASETVLWMRP
jgi:long-subunit acyl-CoA synthetase (AMP-forming)